MKSYDEIKKKLDELVIQWSNNHNFVEQEQIMAKINLLLWVLEDIRLKFDIIS